MINKPLVSIIMPVYGVEDYVGAAIESMQAQTFADYEFLIVDDGSPDRSGEICDEYAAKDPRIKVFHKENGGAPSARNYAMDRASGKYYYFLDGDDTAEPEMLEKMIAVAKRDEAELVVAGFFIDTYYTDDKYREDVYQYEDKTYKDAQSFREDAYKLFDKNLLYTPWNKLWLRSYIEENNLRFPQTFWDDFPFVLSVIRDASKISVMKEPFYHFVRKRAESETAAYRADMFSKREEEHTWMVDLYKYWNVYTDESREFIARRYIERFVGCIENLTNPSCDLPRKKVKSAIGKMIKSPKARWALKYAEPRSFMMKVMLLPIRMKSTALTYLEAKTISFVKSHNTRIFAALKAGR